MVLPPNLPLLGIKRLPGKRGWAFMSLKLWREGCMHAKLFQSCLTLCDAMDCSLPGSCVHGISQARILEWMDFHALLQGLFLTHGLNRAGRVFTTELPWNPCGGISKQKCLADNQWRIWVGMIWVTVQAVRIDDISVGESRARKEQRYAGETWGIFMSRGRDRNRNQQRN